jgi:putative membrane protein
MTLQTSTGGGLERIRNQPIPLPYAMFIRAVAWFFAILVCTRLDTAGHDGMSGMVLSILVMSIFVVAERLGYFLENPLRESPFGLPMESFCESITYQLLGPDHPLSGPRKETPSSK